MRCKTSALLWVIIIFYPFISFAQNKSSEPVHPISISLKWLKKYYNPADHPAQGYVDVSSEFLEYKGDFRNNVPDGYGVVSKYYDQRTIGRFVTWTYEGGMQNGMAEGPGVFITYGYRWTKPVNDQKFKDTITMFRGSFHEGFPIEGMLKMDFDRDNEPMLFYSGGVCFNGNLILQQGWGNMMRSARVKDNVQSTSIGCVGGFYTGQFFNSTITGWGLGNLCREETAAPELIAGLFAADKLIRPFNTLHLDANTLTGRITPVAEKRYADLLAILPEFATTVTKRIQYADYEYYGSVNAKGKPYGLGYVRFADGFRDIGVWNDGVRLHPVALLKKLLPDSTVLTAQLKPLKKNWVEETYASAAPGGSGGWQWRWQHPADDVTAIWNTLPPASYPVITNSPALTGTPVSADTTVILQPWYQVPGGWYVADKELLQRDYRANLNFATTLPGKAYSADHVPDYLQNFAFTALGDDHSIRQLRIEQDNKGKSAGMMRELAMKENSTLNALPQVQIIAGFRDWQHPENSYIDISPGGRLKPALVKMRDLKVNDYVLYAMITCVTGNNGDIVGFDRSFFEDVSDKIVPVFRGYRFMEGHRTTTCEHCHGTGIEPGTSSPGTLNNWAVTSYKTTESWAAPGMVRLTTTPVITNLGQSSPVIGRTCTMCKGWSSSKEVTTVYTSLY